MAVIDPLKVVITNYPENEVEWLEADNNQENEELGKRKIPFTREIYIERADFMENPPKKYFRLFPGNEVRLKYAYFIKCQEVIKDENGEVIELRCTYDPETKSGTGFTGRKVKGTLHWVSVNESINAQVNLYNHLFIKENEDDTEYILNENSIEILDNCYIEPSIKEGKVGERYQFLRHGYFCIDKNSNDNKLVINRITSLRSSFKLKR
jgi:glutaminyl-tRNA synthetase